MADKKKAPQQSVRSTKPVKSPPMESQQPEKANYVSALDAAMANNKKSKPKAVAKKVQTATCNPEPAFNTSEVLDMPAETKLPAYEPGAKCTTENLFLSPEYVKQLEGLQIPPGLYEAQIAPNGDVLNVQLKGSNTLTERIVGKIRLGFSGETSDLPISELKAQAQTNEATTSKAPEHGGVIINGVELPTLYMCDPDKNKNCKKNSCQDSCKLTSYQVFAKDGEQVHALLKEQKKDISALDTGLTGIRRFNDKIVNEHFKKLIESQRATHDLLDCVAATGDLINLKLSTYIDRANRRELFRLIFDLIALGVVIAFGVLVAWKFLLA